MTLTRSDRGFGLATIGQFEPTHLNAYPEPTA